ncbi:MAG TPA: T9SS type A sorting domain-containing protein [Cytophagaceae bacterium]|jgi:hypothetical protein
MKRFFRSLLLFSALSNTVYSQVTFSEFKVPAYGSSIKAKRNEFKGEVGNPGIGQVWDFSKEVYASEPEVVAYTNPKASPNGGAFPNATHCETYSNREEFSAITPTGYTLLGIHREFSDDIVYSDPMTTFRLPMKFGDVQNDKFGAAYTAQFPMIKSGSFQVTYDGFGKLITPTGTYNDVIRLKSTQIEKDSVARDLGAGVSIVYETKATIYAYYLSGYTSPLFSIYYIIQNEVAYDPFSFLYDPAFLSGTRDAFQKDLNVNIYPNPAKDFINVDLSNAEGNYFDISILDQLGVEVYKNKLSGFDSDLYQIPLAGLEKGSYIMKINSDETYMIEKIIVQ